VHLTRPEEALPRVAVGGRRENNREDPRRGCRPEAAHRVDERRLTCTFAVDDVVEPGGVSSLQRGLDISNAIFFFRDDVFARTHAFSSVIRLDDRGESPGQGREGSWRGCSGTVLVGECI
jgi:hypothetical protein